MGWSSGNATYRLVTLAVQAPNPIAARYSKHSPPGKSTTDPNDPLSRDPEDNCACFAHGSDRGLGFYPLSHRPARYLNNDRTWEQGQHVFGRLRVKPSICLPLHSNTSAGDCDETCEPSPRARNGHSTYFRTLLIASALSAFTIAVSPVRRRR